MDLKKTIITKLSNKEFGSTIVIDNITYTVVRKIKYVDMHGNKSTEQATLLNNNDWTVLSEVELKCFLAKLK